MKQAEKNQNQNKLVKAKKHKMSLKISELVASRAYRLAQKEALDEEEKKHEAQRREKQYGGVEAVQASFAAATLGEEACSESSLWAERLPRRCADPCRKTSTTGR